MAKTNFMDTLSPGDTLGAGFTFVERLEDRVFQCGSRKPYARFKCPHCERVTAHQVADVKAKKVVSCGCLKKQGRLKLLTTKNRPLYKIWGAMHRRCYNPKDTAYSYYGGRGVTVCDRWHDPGGFERFELDMAPKYRPGLHLDKDIRFPGNLEYSRLMCQWVTPLVNSQNKRNSLFCLYLGQYMKVAEAASLLGLSYRQVRHWKTQRVPKKYQHLLEFVERNDAI
jgi:hypothetical protein